MSVNQDSSVIREVIKLAIDTSSSWHNIFNGFMMSLKCITPWCWMPQSKSKMVVLVVNNCECHKICCLFTCLFYLGLIQSYIQSPVQLLSMEMLVQCLHTQNTGVKTASKCDDNPSTNIMGKWNLAYRSTSVSYILCRVGWTVSVIWPQLEFRLQDLIWSFSLKCLNVMIRYYQIDEVPFKRKKQKHVFAYC